jgi:hypothetical protein
MKNVKTKEKEQILKGPKMVVWLMNDDDLEGSIYDLIGVLTIQEFEWKYWGK